MQPPETIPTYTVEASIAELARDLKLEPGFRVLELGCGPGAWASFWKSLGGIYDGVDASIEAVAEATRRAYGTAMLRTPEGFVRRPTATGAIFWTRAEDFDAEPGLYDIVFSNTFLQHTSLETKRKLVPKIHVWLKPGGWFLLREKWDVETPTTLTQEGWKSLLEPAGFELVARSETNLVFRKK